MIPQIEPWIDYREMEELKRVVASTFVTEDRLTREFEAMTRDLTGARHAIAMSNGTVAIYCALKALGIGIGDEVIVPDLTFIATANAVIMAGAKPVFCDVYEDTFCIDVEMVGELVNENTKAIMPVHLYGQSADMVEVDQLARKHGLFVVEDAAQGVGVKFMGKHVGTYGDIGVLSYYGNKTITCGEGGMILTDSDQLAEECYRLKNHGRVGKGEFIHEKIGYNFSFTEMQAAIGIAQMKKLPEILKRKEEIHHFYTRELSSVKVLVPCHIDKRCSPVYWMTSFLTNEREELAARLKEKGIQTREFFYPLHLQPCYHDFAITRHEFPHAERIYGRGISLPSSCLLTESQLRYISESVAQYFS